MNAVAVRWSWPADGSSRTSVRGSSASAMASASRFCWPNERVSGGRSRISASSARLDAAEHSGDQRLEAGLVAPEVARPEGQLLADSAREAASATGSGTRSRTSLPDRRRCARRSTRRRRGRRPRARGTSPIAALNSVVFPEPFGPRTATRLAARRGRPSRRGGPCDRRSRPSRRATRAAAASGSVGGPAADRHARLAAPRCVRSRARATATSNGSFTLAGSATRKNPSSWPEVADRSLVEVEHAVRRSEEGVLDAMLDDDDGRARVREAADEAEQASARPAGRGSRAARQARTRRGHEHERARDGHLLATRRPRAGRSCVRRGARARPGRSR